MLQPARRKYRKEQKGRNTGIATRGSSVAFGDFGLKCTDRGRLTARQIEAARRAISRHVKRGAQGQFGSGECESFASQCFWHAHDFKHDLAEIGRAHV